MENLETPYEEEAAFIECTVCDKSIRGETLYKIHLTTAGHIKKEDALIAAGRAVRHHIVPEFKDIVHFLDYLNLDEPIIGLSFLDEVPCNEPHVGLRYTCRLCHQTAILAEMVHHVIGRKHRQKYVELKRPDLVTWDKQSLITQVGKIIRARAEIIERQDGRGSPLQLVKRGTEGKLNISRVPPREKQSRNRYIPQRPTQQNIPPLLPELKDYRNEHFQLVRNSTGYPNTTPFYPDKPDMDRDRQMYEGDVTPSQDVEDELRREDYWKDDTYQQDHTDRNYRRAHGEKYVEDPRICSPRAALEPGGVSRYDSKEAMPHTQSQYVEYYSEDDPSYRTSYSENDPLKEFYTEEVRRGRVRSAEYQSSQLAYSDSAHQWSLERESGRHNSKAGSQGSNEPESTRGSFPSPVESDHSRNHLFNVIRDYHHERRELHQEEAMSTSGAGRQVEITRTISDIPEPFKRFLEGTTNDVHGKRKRKSRFSDATVEEVEITKEMFTGEYGPPSSKFGGRLSLRPEIQRKPHPDRYAESQILHHTKGYQKGGFGTEGVFDMLNNIEIENAEEADFLKNKLCSLLKEFKSKKSEKAAQGRPVISNDYNSLKMDPQVSQQHLYERPLREDSEFRRDEVYFREDQRGRGWKKHEHVHDKQLTEHHHLGLGESRYSNRNHHKEHYGWPEMSRTQHEPTHYSERFQEPMQLHDYQPDAEEHFDSRSSAPPSHMEREPSMHRGSRYSKNLDKITSTLLELVARK